MRVVSVIFDEKYTYFPSFQAFVERRLFDGIVLGEIPLLAGSYTYNFQCILPPSLPTSFEGISADFELNSNFYFE